MLAVPTAAPANIVVCVCVCVCVMRRGCGRRLSAVAAHSVNGRFRLGFRLVIFFFTLSSCAIPSRVMGELFGWRMGCARLKGAIPFVKFQVPLFLFQVPLSLSAGGGASFDSSSADDGDEERTRASKMAPFLTPLGEALLARSDLDAALVSSGVLTSNCTIDSFLAGGELVLVPNRTVDLLLAADGTMDFFLAGGKLVLVPNRTVDLFGRRRHHRLFLAGGEPVTNPKIDFLLDGALVVSICSPGMSVFFRLTCRLRLRSSWTGRRLQRKGPLQQGHPFRDSICDGLIL